MKKYLNQRKQLQLCRAHLINAMELFLSSTINNIFSESLSAEFVVRISYFDLYQRDLAYCAINSSLFMYPNHPEKYEIPTDFIEHDGAISMQRVRGVLQSKNLNEGPFSIKQTVTGFDKNTVYLMFEVLHEDGIDVLNHKIRQIQNQFNCYTRVDVAGEFTDASAESNIFLMQCMLKLIEHFDPDTFSQIDFIDGNIGRITASL